MRKGLIEALRVLEGCLGMALLAAPAGALLGWGLWNAHLQGAATAAGVGWAVGLAMWLFSPNQGKAALETRREE